MKLTPPPITPGPWTELEGFIIGGPWYDEQVHDICDPRCAPPDDDNFVMMGANARAIVALPKVLEALAKNLSFYREMRTGGYCIDCDHEHDVTLQALLEAGYTISEP